MHGVYLQFSPYTRPSLTRRQIETNLESIVLLRLLKKMEEVVGRVPTFRNGPRVVDESTFYSMITASSIRDPRTRGMIRIDDTLELMEGVSRRLGNQLRLFANETCTVFSTQEFYREVESRRRR